ncbi:hypothetical protein ACG04R_27880, partial [Roseateles sp. BYS78W]
AGPAVTIAETGGHDTETTSPTLLNSVGHDDRNDRSRWPKYALGYAVPQRPIDHILANGQLGWRPPTLCIKGAVVVPDGGDEPGGLTLTRCIAWNVKCRPLLPRLERTERTKRFVVRGVEKVGLLFGHRAVSGCVEAVS